MSRFLQTFFSRERRIFIGACILATAAWAEPSATATAPGVRMAPGTERLLRAMLDPAQFESLVTTLSAPGGWGELGPFPRGSKDSAGWDRVDDRRPDRILRLDIPPGTPGSGTEEDPYVGAIGAFLRQFDFEKVSLPAYRGAPDAADVDEVLASLGYEPVVVGIPPGHYLEPGREPSAEGSGGGPRVAALEVPPGVWLRAPEGGVVLEPGEASGRRNGVFVHLHVGAGLEGIGLDGSRVLPFEPGPSVSVHAVQAAHRATVSGCFVRGFPGRGISAAGSRGREGSRVVAVGNVIERIGLSGISAQSEWVVRDNQVRGAGVLRPDGGGGDDGIIVRWGKRTRVLNNLVVMERDPHGRHLISGQVCHECLVAGNLSIAHGPTRMNIGFSDGSNRNRFIGNVALATGEPWKKGARVQAGVHVNGGGNVIRRNVSIGNSFSFRIIGRERGLPGVVEGNYAESGWPRARRLESSDSFHRASHYEASGNQVGLLRRPLVRVDPRRFGFFRRGVLPGADSGSVPVVEPEEQPDHRE